MRYSHILAACLLTAPALADEVEITLVDQLDGIENSYCLDIVGGGRNIDPANGLQAHTCYSYQGQLGRDQIFEMEDVAAGTFFMPRFDVCVTAARAETGGEMSLADCNGSEAQAFTFGGDGKIRPEGAPDLCFTAGEETRLGRNPIHQIKSLTLETCDTELADRQVWRMRMEDD